jgi:DNA-binding response OmpR family regulator
MNTLIDKIINSVKRRDKDFYTREQVIKAIDLFRVKETIVYPSIYHPDITIDGFYISPQRGEFKRDGIPHHLNKKQFAIMYLLMENKDRLVSRKELLETIWGIDYSNHGNLNWYMVGIKKLAPVFNIKGKGYIWGSNHL